MDVMDAINAWTRAALRERSVQDMLADLRAISDTNVEQTEQLLSNPQQWFANHQYTRAQQQQQWIQQQWSSGQYPNFYQQPYQQHQQPFSAYLNYNSSHMYTPPFQFNENEVDHMKVVLLVDNDGNSKATRSLLEGPSLLDHARVYVFKQHCPFDVRQPTRPDVIEVDQGQAGRRRGRAADRGRRDGAAGHGLVQATLFLHNLLPYSCKFIFVSKNKAVVNAATAVVRAQEPTRPFLVLDRDCDSDSGPRACDSPNPTVWRHIVGALEEAEAVVGLRQIRDCAIRDVAKRALERLQNSQPVNSKAACNLLLYTIMTPAERELLGADLSPVLAQLTRNGVLISAEGQARVRYSRVEAVEIKCAGAEPRGWSADRCRVHDERIGVAFSTELGGTRQRFACGYSGSTGELYTMNLGDGEVITSMRTWWVYDILHNVEFKTNMLGPDGEPRSLSIPSRSLAPSEHKPVLHEAPAGTSIVALQGQTYGEFITRLGARIRTLPPPPTLPLCKYVLRRICNRGDKCPFPHGDPHSSGSAAAPLPSDPAATPAASAPDAPLPNGPGEGTPSFQDGGAQAQPVTSNAKRAFEAAESSDGRKCARKGADAALPLPPTPAAFPAALLLAAGWRDDPQPPVSLS